ncbi:hypothetical protein P280DRAFT_463296 [Massarina eburnea CBS 473.64]|uniref:Metalloendopeptidase n=1 Tax=Massarina eburnea CBS 473.64 TaxID=1395130 RepID=A0A6A6RGH3_9PLEO|nr:hypothetical protein P280DRAFT_463296 [Massarina eburnea CBS 473.64]
MKCFDIFFALLITILSSTLACSPPYLECSNDKPSGNLSKRGTGGLRGDNIQPWPINRPQAGLRVIWFCFASKEDRDKLCNYFYGGLKMWEQQLGGWGSPTSGHSIYFQETFFKETPESMPGPRFCFKDGTWDYEKETGDWNPYVHPDTLMIRLSKKSFWSTVAYRTTNDPGRHALGITDDLDPNKKAMHISYVAHEIGHTMGMVHEHQRKDRDDYVTVNYHNIVNYEQAKTQFLADDKTMDEEGADWLLQTTYTYPKKYDTPAYEFMKPNEGQIGPPTDLLWVDHREPFDLESIMLYHSQAHVQDREKASREQDSCSILKIVKDDHGNRIGLDFVRPNWLPSKGDAAWVKRNYPYQGPQTLPQNPPQDPGSGPAS